MISLKYLAAVAAAGAIPAFTFAAGPMHGLAKGLVRGTISSVSGNTVTLTVDNSANLQTGDTVGIVDQAISLRNGNLAGKVTAVNGDTFTVQRGQNTVSVNASDSTKFTANGQTSSLDAIVQGAFVHVKGVWDATADALNATTVNIFTQFRAGLRLGHHHQMTPSPTPSP
ncbi:MAG TPA: DUF5666 domain-containing protein [Candidatus Paceibacterota bacterium]|nr:DUF5666 domain-containing protein [Candidatus Paceibacterota bacterium]